MDDVTTVNGLSTVCLDGEVVLMIERETMTAADTHSSMILTGRKLSLVRAGWWILFGVYTVFMMFGIWYRVRILSQSIEYYAYQTPLFVATNLIAWLLSIALFIRKQDDWAVIPVTVMFFTSESALPFFIWVLDHDWGVPLEVRSYIAQSLAQPFDLFSLIVTLGVYLTFPGGQWISLKARRFFRRTLILSPLLLLLYWIQPVDTSGSFFAIITTFLEFRAAYMLFMYYRKMENSIQRQQIKWVVLSFLLLVCIWAITILLVLILLAYLLYNGFSSNPIATDIPSFELLARFFSLMGMISTISNLGVMIAFSISIFRYRLWDVEFIINKALVYGGLTALLGGLALISTALIDFGIEQWFGKEEPSVWAVIISALPVATAFNPLRDRLQKWVDKYFKPEEFNFGDAFVEFLPDVRKMLTTMEIVQILSEQVKKQLNVDFAKVYLLGKDNDLHGSRSNSEPEGQGDLPLTDNQLVQLRKGEVVVDVDGVPYSLLIPLVVRRARIPDFLGLIVLGCRLEGKGYSTQILNNLQLLGADAGKAIYLSQLKEQAGMKVTA